MKKIRIIILEEEEQYARKLAEAIRHCETEKIDAAWYSSKENFWQAGKAADLILLGEEFQEIEFVEELAKKGAGRPVLLAVESVKEELVSYPVLLKFQAVEKIISGIYRIAADTAEDHLIPLNTSKEVFGVYAPWNYEISMLFSKVMAQILAEDRSLLYISVAEGCGGRCGEDREEDLADFISFLRRGRGNAQARLKSICRKSGSIHYLPAAENPQNTWEMSKKDYRNLWTALSADNEHDILLFEFGAAYEGIYEDMNRCNRIYCPYQEVFEYEVQQQMEYIFRIYGQRELLEKIAYVKIPYIRKESGSVGGTQENLVQELLYSEFGDRLRGNWHGE